MEHSTGDRLIWVDFIRIVGAFLVVGIHCADVYSESTPELVGNVNWLISGFYDNFLRCAVPFFVMISGYLLLRKTRPLEDSIASRVMRILVVLVAWSVIYLLVRKIYIGKTVDGDPITVYTMLQCILSGRASIHLWFLYMICSLYLVAPILQSYLHSATERNLRYFMWLWWFAALVWPTLSLIVTSCFGIERINFDFYIVTEFLGYFVAGYYYGGKSIRGRTCACFALSLIAMSAAITLAVYFTGYRGFDRLELYSLMQPAFVVLFFMVLKHVGGGSRLASPRIVPLLQRVAALTFGIYLVHILVLRVLSDGLLGFSLAVPSLTPLLSIPLVSLIIFVLSAGIVFLGQKIPVVRRIFP